MKPTLILLNGPSSAGKTTIARELQRIAPAPLLHAQVDSFAHMLPPSAAGCCLKDAAGGYATAVVHSFHEALVALARSGHSVIADHVIGEDRTWLQDLVELSDGIRVICVGVQCDLQVLLDRECSRLDRETHREVAVRQHHSIHSDFRYDVEVDTTHLSPAKCAEKILEVLCQGSSGAAWERLKRTLALQTNVSTPSPVTQLEQGYVQIYTGEGKGKTTAAAGLALLACGAGLRVFIGQFIKARDSHEMAVLRTRCPEVTVEQFGHGRFIKGKPSDEDITTAHHGIERILHAMTSGEYDMIIADEANGAVNAGVIDVKDLMTLIECRPANLELIVTGRNAHQRVLDRADLITEMRNVKHCFDAGVPAREGIEY